MFKLTLVVDAKLCPGGDLQYLEDKKKSQDITDSGRR